MSDIRDINGKPIRVNDRVVDTRPDGRHGVVVKLLTSRVVTVKFVYPNTPREVAIASRYLRVLP